MIDFFMIGGLIILIISMMFLACCLDSVDTSPKCSDNDPHTFGQWRTFGLDIQIRSCTKCGWTERRWI